jgi:hypothetical protein
MTVTVNLIICANNYDKIKGKETKQNPAPDIILQFHGHFIISQAFFYFILAEYHTVNCPTQGLKEAL